MVVDAGIGLRRFDPAGLELGRQELPGLDPWALALAPDGSIAIAGSTPGLPSGLVVRKLRLSGDELWTRTVLGDGSVAHAIAIGPGGEVVAGGATFLTSDGHFRPWLHKFDAAGSELWARDGGVGTIRGLAIDPRGDVAVAKDSGSPFSVRTYDSAGNVLWSVDNSPGPVGVRQLDAVAFDGQGALVVVGSVSVTNHVFAVPADIFVAKYPP
jgi:outer membrane protein assembly factor BamB